MVQAERGERGSAPHRCVWLQQSLPGTSDGVAADDRELFAEELCVGTAARKARETARAFAQYRRRLEEAGHA
ncbi:hypothetical protein [Curtobacterium sp. MCSS17_008]|uniref:hypothetical protein n=1 Tax=Curtobacterium sp. MCSS17_008 TaxID=2175647 RepID=UPI0011B740CA|nr:hypothetical protein [Curtobacterium sp. MCSS17_008]